MNKAGTITSDKKSNKVAPDVLNDAAHDIHGDVNPVIGTDQEEEDENNANKILDRSQLMDHMLFPENGPTLVIVPSNKQGTGFLNHCYDE